MIVEFSKRVPPPAYKEKTRYYYRIKSHNGQVMLLSRPYSTYRKCVEGFRTVQKNFGIDDMRIHFRWQKGM